MARPIKDTPIIKGEDAKRFRQNLKQSSPGNLSASERTKKRKKQKEMEDSYRLMVQISDGTFS